MRYCSICYLVLFILILNPTAQANAEPQPKPATAATIAAQEAVAASMPKEDDRDAKWVHQGFIATFEDPITRNAKGDIVDDPTANEWMTGEAPPTVNPLLWRHQKLLNVHGLFQVSDNIWQVRGFLATNMTIVRGKKGWVIIDPALTIETASKAMELVNKHLGKRPITGVIYSHSHVDHFGGVKAVLSGQKEIPPILAPEGFVEESGTEWVKAGNVMMRRSSFLWGQQLPNNAMGYVGTGLTNDTPIGTISLIPPSDVIRNTGETRVIDGVTIEFQMVPETEAVAEMNLYFPRDKVLFIAEFATATMHNLQTPRGAKSRDALSWAGYLTELLDRYGNKTDATIFGHTWPRFGNAEIRNFIKLQRDNYKYIHDQTVRMANMGLTPTEIAETLTPPDGIASEWSTHGYYGTYKHNAKGVFMYYVGWWDGIPAHLDSLPTVEQAKRYVDVIGASRLMKKAHEAFAQGEYRWSAELLNNMVFAEPTHQEARELLADSYEQLGYQAESAAWRNIYLTGAAELRGMKPTPLAFYSEDLANSMSTGSFLDMVASRINPKKISDDLITLNLNVTDTNEAVGVSVSNKVLVHRVGKPFDHANVTLTGNRKQLKALFLGLQPIPAMQAAGLQIEGNTDLLAYLQNAIEIPPADFPLVTP